MATINHTDIQSTTANSVKEDIRSRKNHVLMGINCARNVANKIILPQKYIFISLNDDSMITAINMHSISGKVFFAYLEFNGKYDMFQLDCRAAASVIP